LIEKKLTNQNFFFSRARVNKLTILSSGSGTDLKEVRNEKKRNRKLGGKLKFAVELNGHDVHTSAVTGHA
jgi:hypothetical protein